MPVVETVMGWLDSVPEFETLYRQARASQAELHADDILGIADTAADRDTAAAAKVRIDARKWLASRMKPEIYGDRLALTGPDGGPVQVVQRLTDARKRMDFIEADYTMIDDQSVTSENDDLAKLLE